MEIEEISRTFSRSKALNKQPGSRRMRVGVLPAAGDEPIVLGTSTPRQCEVFEGLMAEFGYRPVELRRYTRGVELDVVFVPEGKVGEVLRTL